MNKSLKQYGLILLFFIVLAMIVFRCGWGADRIFNGSDNNIGLTASAHRSLPERFSGTYGTAPVFGGSSSVPVSFLNIGQWLFPPALFTDTWYSVYLILSSIFLIAYLRLWKLRWTSCVLGAVVAFWLGSITISAAGHLAKLGVMMFFTLALFLVEKGIRSSSHWGRTGFGIGAGIATGWMLLEQQDVALLAGLFLGAYTLFRLFQSSAKKPMVWVELLAPIAVIGLLMAASTATKAYKANVTDVGLQKDSQVQWEYITQWSMVPAELPDLIAPGYTGWSSNNPEGPYWGKVGQSSEWETTKKGIRNFRLDSLYLGVIPIFLALIGIVAAFHFRKEEGERSAAMFCWAGLALIALLLAFGKYSPLYKLFYHLPLVGNIRAPIKFLHNFQVIIGLLAAFGLDYLMTTVGRERNKECKILILIAVAFGALAVVLGMYAGSSSGVERFAEWGDQASVISTNIRQAWMHAAVMCGIFSLSVYLSGKLRYQNIGVVMCLVFTLTVLSDSVYLTGKYFKAEKISALKAGNPIINYLKAEQGDERIFCFSQSGVYNLWISQDFLYHGIKAFNFGQMPRMPGDYKAFFSEMNKNWPRMVQLSSCRYGLMPATTFSAITKDVLLKDSVEPLFAYRFVMVDERASAVQIQKIEHPNDQVLVRFKHSLPRFSLFSSWETTPDEKACSRLVDQAFDPRKAVLLSTTTPIDAEPSDTCELQQVIVDRMDSRSAELTVRSESGGLVLFTQRHQPGWSAYVDGQKTEILKCNYLNLGVYVPSGEHNIVFKCPRTTGLLFLKIMTIACGLIGGVILVGSKKGRKN